MIHFTIGYCNIETTIHALKKFAHDTYHRYHKSSRMKHMVLDDERYPDLKITDDIFSLQVWIITPYGEEQRIFLDGTVYLNKVVINSAFLEGAHFNEEVHSEFNRVLKDLSAIGEGCIYAETQKSPTRYQRGKVVQYASLLDEIYNSLSDEKKKEHKLVYEALQVGFVFEDN